MKIDEGDHGKLATSIGNAITRLHREYYGRGATTTRTLVQRDCVIVLLEDIYTAAERTLIDSGDEETVRTTRAKFQLAMKPTFCEAIEQLTGRRVRAFFSAVHFAPDMASEVFVLEPNPVERE